MNVTKPVLLISTSYEPLRIVHGRDAVRLMLNGKVDVVVERDFDVHANFRMPSVIRLREYKRIPYTVKVLSRRNIHQRDDHRCMYCNKRCRAEDLSLDHVIPRSRGGESTWENMVTACKKCNHQKADRTPEEAGMPLRRRPLPRTIHTSRHVLRAMGEGIPEWDPFMFRDSNGETKLTRHG